MPLQPVTFTIAGRPVPWARAGTNSGRRFTPRRQADHQALVAGHALGAMSRARLRRCVYDEAVHGVSVSATFRVSGNVGDTDNYLKQLLDGLQGVPYTDDRVVVHIAALRLPAGARGESTTVTIGPFDPEDHL